MKKLLFSFMAIALLSSVSFADCAQNCQKDYQNYNCEQKSPCNCQEKKNPCQNPNYEKTNCQNPDGCSKKCLTEDDEYCVYNQCYLDKHFRNMKKALCLSKTQEPCIDNIYRNFKADMEMQCTKYRREKDKLLEMIECENDCWKEQRNVVKEICKETKEKCKEFRDDVKEQICKEQRGDFRRFMRSEKKKMKRIVKYGAVYKLPCKDCCND